MATSLARFAAEFYCGDLPYRPRRDLHIPYLDNASRDFENYRHDLCAQGDAESVWYRRQLLPAKWASRRAGVPNRDIAAVA